MRPPHSAWIRANTVPKVPDEGGSRDVLAVLVRTSLLVLLALALVRFLLIPLFVD